MKSKFLLGLLVTIMYCHNPVAAQIFATPQTISGIINTYTKVTAISSATSVTVTSAAGFNVGNKALLIQMQGASISTGDNANFGKISSINNAGNYEVLTISAVAGSVITFTTSMSNAYTIAGNVQLITLPEYNAGATVSATLTAQAWNGATGGVLALYASTITLNAHIDVTAKGFRRGITNGGGGACYNPGYAYSNTGTTVHSDTVWSYGTVAITCANGTSASAGWASVCSGAWRSAFSPGCGCYVTVPACNNQAVFDSATYKNGQNFSCYGKTGYYLSSYNNTGAEKGEGIAQPIAGSTAGRAPISNGGGGGNEHNGGGGGGGNYGKGGLGGMDLSQCFAGLQTTPVNQKDSAARGWGGVALAPYYNCRVFMGGGAGSGQGNDNQNTPGVEGGGIILLKATSISNAGGFKIMANGMTNNLPANSGGAIAASADGAGGGGGGGAILLDVGSFVNATAIEANGGKGGDNTITGDCYAPGGGGGGGVVWFTQPTTPANAAPSAAGGLSGTEINSTTNGCNLGDLRYGARAGANGAVLYSLTIPSNGVGCTALPVRLLSFEATYQHENVELRWTTYTDEDMIGYSIEKSTDGQAWELLSFVPSHDRLNSVNEHTYQDPAIEPGKFYYKIKVIENQTNSFYSSVRAVNILGNETYYIYPNPSSEETSSLYIKTFLGKAHNSQVTILDMTGNTVWTDDLSITPGSGTELILSTTLSKGIYAVWVQSSLQSSVFKWVVK